MREMRVGRYIVGSLAGAVALVSASQLALAEGQQPGPDHWLVQDDTSALDGSRTVAAQLNSSNTVVDAAGGEQAASLVMRCKAHQLVAYVWWPAFMGLGRSMLSSGNKSVVWRLDQGEVKKDRWSISDDGLSTGQFDAKQARPWLEKLAGAKRLVVQAAPYQRDTVEAVFDLQDVAVVAGKVLAACPET